MTYAERLNFKHYTARTLEDGRIGVRMPGTEYGLSPAEARRLRDSLTVALPPPQKALKRTPMWILSLRSLAVSGIPLFSGLLEEEDGRPRWSQDAELVNFMEQGWVTIVEGGFVITEEGKKVYEQEWNKHQ